MITELSIHRYKSFHPTTPPPIHFEANTPPQPVFLYGINGAGKSAIGEVIQGLAGKEAEFTHCALKTSNNADYRILVYNQRFVDKVIRTAGGGAWNFHHWRPRRCHPGGDRREASRNRKA